MDEKETEQLRGPSEENEREIVPILQGYLQEAKQARSGGLNPRDMKWEENLNLYWNRLDFSDKAEWQAKEKLPEVPTFVDRFAAALKEALVNSPDGFYTVIDPADKEGDLTGAIKRMTDVWLSMCGRNQTGTCLGFPAVFEEQTKMGAIMSCSSVVKWDPKFRYGRVAIESVDPRNIWLDHTYRNLYRIRRVELDKHELMKMAKMADRKGRSIYNLDAIERMVSHIDFETRKAREDASGVGQETSSTRQPIILDEYIATVVSPSGRVLAEEALMVVGNEQFLIRGPEPNPFWHKRDWLVYAPLVIAPFSVYGRSYMEDFGSVAGTFNRLTNLILDAVQVSSMKAFALVPDMLKDPAQAAGGIWPNKVFELEDGNLPSDFMKSLDLGALPPESVQVWQAMKNELREAADINEVGLGQFAPKSRTSATEISETMQSSSALIRSIAQTLESRWLQPTLDLVWHTGIQHADPNDPVLKRAAGEQLYGALMAQRRELVKMSPSFQARGISTLIQKGTTLRSLMQVLGMLAQSPELLAEFMKAVSIERFVKLLFDLSNVDLHKVEIGEREKMMRETQERMMMAQQQALAAQAPAQRGQPPAPGAQQLAQQMGVAPQ